MLLSAGWELATSALSQVEVQRALKRDTISGRLTSDSKADLTDSLFSGINIIDIDQAVIDEACEIDGAALRSLDAIHLATARLIEADLVISYDDRMLRACMDAGVMTAQPGASRPVLAEGWEIVPVTDDIDSTLLDQYEAAFFGPE